MENLVTILPAVVFVYVFVSILVATGGLLGIMVSWLLAHVPCNYTVHYTVCFDYMHAVLLLGS